MKDEIIQELWQIKDELAREVNYNVHLLCRELRERQTASQAHVVDRSTGAAAVQVQTEGRDAMTVTLVCWRDKDWYVGRAKEVPGVFSQGKSLAALQENLADAVRLMLAEGNDNGQDDAGVPSCPSDPPCLKTSVQLQLPEDTGDD